MTPNRFVKHQSSRATSLSNQQCRQSLDNKAPKIHSIRLHGPWDAKVLESYTQQPPSISAASQSQRLKIPCDWGDWLSDSFRGRVRLQRKFHQPTGLVDGQKIFLVIQQVDLNATITLNDVPLGACNFNTPSRIEITNTIKPFNLLEIDIEKPLAIPDDHPRLKMAGGLIGEVRLEIVQ